MEAYVVLDICAPISNQEIDRAKRCYAHLKKIDLADSNHGNEEMEIQLLIGADYMWSFFTGEIARGEQEIGPVASKTSLGWVLSGPISTTKKQKLSNITQEREQREGVNKADIATKDDESYAKTTVGGLEEIDPTTEHKVLGLNWNLKNDTFILKLNKISNLGKGLEPTKRNVLKVAAKLFDPLGLISPATVQLRMLLQDLCAKKYDWDKLVSNDLWWNGPTWLKQSPQSYPMSEKIEETEDQSEECLKELRVKAISTTTATNLVKETTSVKNTNLSRIIDITRFSCLAKLLRVTALVFRFVKILKEKHNDYQCSENIVLTTAEITEARNTWIRNCQIELEQQPNYETLQQQLGVNTVSEQKKLSEEKNETVESSKPARRKAAIKADTVRRLFDQR
ncbi:Hypothetical predicted protein [Paramuricea clavata]|uniref:Uncharacterized protein n=1 Tax=Paramuricea clavata TaxID=317549 RepID=A0A7D9IAK3_PARCT|nr:Hypothetical predicted protein [Paramuricea clavata]